MTSTLSGRDRFSKVIAYNTDEGKLVWKRPRQGAAGRRAGSSTKHGYREVTVFGKNYKEHRLAWFLATNRWPAGVIDHVNGDRSDNRFCNLRDVSVRQNCVNRHDVAEDHLPGTTKSGSVWRAQITLEGKHKHLGTFWTKEEAHQAYLNALKEAGV